ncbi:MAG: sigma-70 family RNA polymerase sigma factor [Bacteroidota bacterium]
MKTLDIYNTFSDELYFFILKKVNSKEVANDIFQNTFLKIHRHLPQLNAPEKVKAWVFQIARNETINYFKAESTHTDPADMNKEAIASDIQFVCCFDKLINELPEKYKAVIELVYIDGYKQTDAAKALDISLENTKARIHRAKELLKTKFQACCKYELNPSGKLTGEANCSTC